MRRFFVLHARLRQFVKAWDRADRGVHAHAAASVIDVDFLRRRQAGLGDAIIDDEPLRRRLEANYTLLETFARSWQAIAAERTPRSPGSSPRRSQASRGCSTSARCG